MDIAASTAKFLVPNATFFLQEFGIIYFSVNADIHRNHVGVKGLSQLIYRRRSVGNGIGASGSYRAVRLGNALLNDTVVGAQNHNGSVVDTHIRCALNGSNFDDSFFQ